MLDELSCFTNTINKYHNQESSDIVIAALQMSSQLARNSEAYFPQLLAVLVPEKIIQLLSHTNYLILSKTCNLIGNICR